MFPVDGTINEVNWRHPNARGLRHFLPMTEGGGGALYDLAGRNWISNGTAIPGWTPGPRGERVLLLPTWQRLNNWNWPVNRPVTVSFFLRPATPGVSGGSLLYAETAAVYKLNLHAPWNDNIFYFDWQVGARASTDIAAYLGKWTAFACRSNAVAANGPLVHDVWVNGKFAASAAPGATTSTVVPFLEIGLWSAVPNYQLGAVCDLRIHDVIKTPEEIARLADPDLHWDILKPPVNMADVCGGMVSPFFARNVR